MVCLSRTDIEKISDEIIAAYKAAYVPEKRLCYQVDAMELAQLPWLFRRKASPTGGTKGKTANHEISSLFLLFLAFVTSKSARND